jgi:hypothetical protein
MKKSVAKPTRTDARAPHPRASVQSPASYCVAGPCFFYLTYAQPAYLGLMRPRRLVLPRLLSLRIAAAGTLGELVLPEALEPIRHASLHNRSSRPLVGNNVPAFGFSQSPMPLVFNDPQHWLDRAAEAQALADKMTDQNGQARMLAIAEQYFLLAQRAMIRLKAGALAKLPENVG